MAFKPYHLVDLALHALLCIGLFEIFRQLLRDPVAVFVSTAFFAKLFAFAQFPTSRPKMKVAVRSMQSTLGRCDMVSICGESMKESTDEQLVQECLRGNQDAWTAIIRRYRNLIYGVIRSYRPPDSDAADIFQSVCVELFHDLPRLREATALRGWLITVANRQCLRWKSLQRRTTVEGELVDPDSVPDELNSERLAEIERVQILRQAMDTLPSRCREMIRLLFLQPAPIPYDELANHLGLAVGSIGFIRRRCLDKLKSVLDKAGF